MTTLFSDDFTGSNGSSLNATRWPTISTNGGSVNVQGNQARFTTVATAFWEEQALAQNGLLADFDLTLDIEIQSVTNWHFPYVMYRSDANGANTGDYFRLALSVDNVNVDYVIERYDNYAPTSMAANITEAVLAANDVVHVRIRVEGSQHQIRWWRNSDPEPGTWGFSFTDATYASNTGLHIGNQTGVAVATSVDFDNVVMNDFSISATAATALGSGVAFNARARVSARPNHATATGVASNATVREQPPVSTPGINVALLESGWSKLLEDGSYALLESGGSALSLPITHDWTGTNGDPWDAAVWAHTAGSGSNTVTIQSNKGQMVISDGGYGRSLLNMVDVADFDLTVQTQISTLVGSAQQISFRADTDWYLGTGSGDPNDGYIAYIVNGADGTPATIEVGKHVAGGAYSVVATGSWTAAGASLVNMRLWVEGTAIRFRAWKDGLAEPTTWQIDTTDTSHTTGKIGLQSFANATFTWDNLAIVTPAAFPVYHNADTTSGSISTTATSMSVTYPANIDSGDLLLFFGGTASNITTSISGFTAVANGSNTAELHIFKKVATGSETGTVTWDFGGASDVGAWAMYRISGSSGDVEAASFSAATGTTVNPPAVTPSWGLLNNGFVGVGVYVDGNITMSAGSGNLNNDLNVRTSSTAPGVGLVVGNAESAAASYDPSSFTISASTARTGTTLAIKPGIGVPSSGTTANATQADAMGTAYAATAALRIPATEATATGVANNATVRASSQAGQAAATGVANAANPRVAPIAPNATATGAGQDATERVATNASAAMALASAFDATVRTSTNASVAAATGAGQDVPPEISINGGSASTISVQGSFNALTGSGPTAALTSVAVSAGATKLVVAISVRDITGTDRVVSGVTRDGQSFSFAVAADTAANNRAEIWYLDNPNTGTADVDITLGGANGFMGAGAIVLESANPGAAEDTDTDTGSGANPSLTLSSTPGAFVIGVSSFENQDGGFAAADTVVFNVASTRRRVSSYEIATTGSTGIEYTNTAIAHAFAAASFPPASTSNTATASGTAFDATTSTAVVTNANATEATATGAAFNATVRITIPGATATAAGTANTPAPSERVNATLATATGSAFDATPSSRPVATTATATGVANNPGGRVTTPSTTATATGVANAPTALVKPVADTATAVGVANNAIAQSGASEIANASDGAATATAYDAKAIVSGRPTHASATGAAQDSDPVVRTGAENASATATAISAQAVVRTNAGQAAATGAANTAGTSARSNPTTATATGAANAPTARVAPRATTATATGVGHNATVTTVEPVLAPATTATASATAFNASVRITPNAAPAAAVGTGSTPDDHIDAAPSTATGSAAAESPDARVAPRATHGAATASGYAPTSSSSAGAGSAEATATSDTSSSLVRARAGHATALGAGYNATFFIGARSFAYAGAAEANAMAFNAGNRVRSGAITATAATAGHTPATRIRTAPAQVATASNTSTNSRPWLRPRPIAATASVLGFNRGTIRITSTPSPGNAVVLVLNAHFATTIMGDLPTIGVGDRVIIQEVGYTGSRIQVSGVASPRVSVNGVGSGEDRVDISGV